MDVSFDDVPVACGREERLRGERPVMDADVIIVGAGPTGLMLAGELRLAGVRPLVLERQPQLREIPKANGFSGQIVELLRYRGLIDRIEAASIAPIDTAPRLPFPATRMRPSRYRLKLAADIHGWAPAGYTPGTTVLTPD